MRFGDHTNSLMASNALKNVEGLARQTFLYQKLDVRINMDNDPNLTLKMPHFGPPSVRIGNGI
jgi:hypothetical protein